MMNMPSSTPGLEVMFHLKPGFYRASQKGEIDRLPTAFTISQTDMNMSIKNITMIIHDFNHPQDERQGKAIQHSPKAVIFQRKNLLPWVGHQLQPMTLII